MNRDFSILLLLLPIAGIILLSTSIKGTFIVDELNYMAAADGVYHGTLSVPHTENLPPSKELYFFDPEANNRVAAKGPVVTLVAPLYAPIAAPFLLWGWRGLILLNIISFLSTSAIIFLLLRRFSTDRFIPWLGCALFFFGGYGIEYAQAVWPHMLALFFVTAAFYFASFSLLDEEKWKPFVAGILAGIAAGVREQNIFLAVCIGAAIFFWGKKRWQSSFFYTAGLIIIVLVISVLNFYRFGYPNPFPKTNFYAHQVSTEFSGGSILSSADAFYSKVVDFSAVPVLTESTYSRVNETNAVLVGSAVKKALLQSSPWVALALAAMIIAWVKKKTFRTEQTAILRALSFLVLPTIAMFTLAGYGKTDGMSFNQRYFHELVPLFAIAAALSLDGSGMKKRYFYFGCFLSILFFFFLFLFQAWDFRHLVILRYPLILASLSVLLWIFRDKSKALLMFSLSLGLCLGWACAVHIADDVLESRRIKQINADKLAEFESILPDYSALFTYHGGKDAAGPLILTKDIVILDTWADDGKDAPLLKNVLRRQHRKIFIDGDYFPKQIRDQIAGNDSLIVKKKYPSVLYEVVTNDSISKGTL
jgi:hypothetical protein